MTVTNATKTKYTKTNFDKLKQSVANNVYTYGLENDSCEEEMIRFIQDALDITEKEATELFKVAEEKNVNKYRLVIELSSPDEHLKVYSGLEVEDVENMFMSGYDGVRAVTSVKLEKVK